MDNPSVPVLRRERARKLKHSPLVLTVCQIRFPRILGFENHAAALHRCFKGAGFPRFLEDTTPVVLEPGTDGAKLRLAKRFHFVRGDKNGEVVVSETFLALLTSQYHTFEGMLKSILETADIVREVCEVLMAAQGRLGGAIRRFHE